MRSSPKCIIGSVIGAVIVVAAGVGIYFAVSGGSSESKNEKPQTGDPNDSSTDKLLLKSIDGTVKLYDRKTKKFISTQIEEKTFGVTSFGPHLDQTIYYATSETDSVIRSTNNKTFPDLPGFTADWIKTAIAVDDVTKKVYVVDRITPQINVVDGNYQHTLLLQLTEPKDLVLVPESGKMFILENSRIIMANMDGTEQTEVVKADNLHAMTADPANGVVYFAHPKGISSYDYSNSKKVAVVNEEQTKVTSLAYKDKVLYFVNKKGKSSKLTGTSLDNCRLDESKCAGQCCSVFSVHKNENLEQVKIYKSEKPQAKNPCETENGGCEHLCLLNSSKEGYSCACDKDWTLESDKKTCKAPVDPNDGSEDKLFVKSTDGTIKVYDRKTKVFTTTEIEAKPYGILSFGPHLDQTIHYATTEAGSVIQSTKKEAFPDLPSFTADWIKTAIAVDDVTKKVYVVDRVTPQINVVGGNYEYALPLELTEPKDVVLVPEIGKMFVLEESRIIMANMDGTEHEDVVKAENLQAMTVDTTNGILYFAHPEGISSYDYRTSKVRRVINRAQTKVASLAYKDKVLYFINKKGKSSKVTGTSLDNCRLDESKCAGQCCSIFNVYKNENLEQVKIYKSDQPQTKNPCETENGGCQHLCLLNSSEEGRSCACSKGWKLQSDDKTCVEDTKEGSKKR